MKVTTHTSPLRGSSLVTAGNFSRGHRSAVRKSFIALCVAASCLAIPQAALHAAPLRAGFNTTTFPGNDDSSLGPIALGFSNTINFFGNNYATLFVNNNGNVTFNSPLSTFTPFGLSSTSVPIIAPFFADVDTRTTNDATFGTGTVNGLEAFGVNWIDVGYFSQNNDKLNTFQLVLINRNDLGIGDFDIEFNYGKIQWETGEASGGVDGLGGNSAVAGYANGTGSFFEIMGSNVDGAFLDSNPTGLINSSNIGSPGTFLFQVRNGLIIPPAPGVPVPETGNFLVGLACLGLIAFARPRESVAA